MRNYLFGVLLSLFILSPVLAATCPQNPGEPLPDGWHCTGSSCQEADFVHAAFAGHKTFGTVTCFYQNQGMNFSVYAWISGGTKGEDWNPNSQGERCYSSIEACQFGEVLTK